MLTSISTPPYSPKSPIPAYFSQGDLSDLVEVLIKHALAAGDVHGFSRLRRFTQESVLLGVLCQAERGEMAASDPPKAALQRLPRVALAPRAALAFGSGFVHRQDVSTEFRAVKPGNGLLGLRRIGKLCKPKTS